MTKETSPSRRDSRDTWTREGGKFINDFTVEEGLLKDL